MTDRNFWTKITTRKKVIVKIKKNIIIINKYQYKPIGHSLHLEF